MDTPNAEGIFDSFSWILLPHWATHWSQSAQLNSVFACFSANSPESPLPLILFQYIVPLQNFTNSTQPSQKALQTWCWKDDQHHPGQERSTTSLHGAAATPHPGGMLLWQWHYAYVAVLKAHLEASQQEPKQRYVTTQLHRENRSICNTRLF